MYHYWALGPARDASVPGTPEAFFMVQRPVTRFHDVERQLPGTPFPQWPNSNWGTA